MKKSERFLFCTLLAIICSFMISTQAMATHADNITELSDLLPGMLVVPLQLISIIFLEALQPRSLTY